MTVIHALSAVTLMLGLLTAVPILDGGDAAHASQSLTVGTATSALAGTNVRRGTDELVIYTPAHGSTTRTNEWGAEAVVVDGKVTTLRDRQTSRATATTIPRNGVVLSGHGVSRQFLLTHARVGTNVVVPGVPARAPAPVTNPLTNASTVKLGDGTFPIAGTDTHRSTDDLTVYTPEHGPTTGTNEWGAEAVVVDGKVTALRDRQTTRATATTIPRNGIVLSGHGTARQFLLKGATVGASVSPGTEASPPPTTPPIASPSPGEASSALYLPSKVVAGYWPSWSSTRLNTIDDNYNVVFLAFATGSPNNTGTGGVSYNTRFSNAQMKADIAELRARGTRVILAVGGEGGYTHLDSSSRRQAFLDSIVTINDQVGPLDGLDWNFETNYIAAPYRQAIVGDVQQNIIWVSRQLKDRYGQSFAITKPPSPSSTHDRNWMAAMHQAGVIDLVMPQWYDGGQGSANVGNVDWWASALGGDHSKVGIGVRTNIGYTNNGASPNGTGSYMQIQSLWSQLSSQRPRLRGAFVWHTGIDAQESYWFARNMGPSISN